LPFADALLLPEPVFRPPASISSTFCCLIRSDEVGSDEVGSDQVGSNGFGSDVVVSDGVGSNGVGSDGVVVVVARWEISGYVCCHSATLRSVAMCPHIWQQHPAGKMGCSCCWPGLTSVRRKLPYCHPNHQKDGALTPRSNRFWSPAPPEEGAQAVEVLFLEGEGKKMKGERQEKRSLCKAAPINRNAQNGLGPPDRITLAV
jgi:hypothetical protein